MHYLQLLPATILGFCRTEVKRNLQKKYPLNKPPTLFLLSSKNIPVNIKHCVRNDVRLIKATLM